MSNQAGSAESFVDTSQKLKKKKNDSIQCTFSAQYCALSSSRVYKKWQIWQTKVYHCVISVVFDSIGTLEKK